MIGRMRLSFVVNILLVFALATTIIGAGLFLNLLAVPGGNASATTPPPNTGPLPTFTPAPSPLLTDTPSPAATVRPSLGTTYIVEPGDSLAAIGLLYGIDWHLIYEANKDLIPPDFTLQPGWELTIPQPASRCGDYEAYTVVAGDFLVKIGDQFGVSATDIADFNSLPFPGRSDWSDIRPGDVLCIPQPGWTALPTATPTP
jgi:LysM repeat protein